MSRQLVVATCAKLWPVLVTIFNSRTTYILTKFGSWAKINSLLNGPQVLCIDRAFERLIVNNYIYIQILIYKYDNNRTLYMSVVFHSTRPGTSRLPLWIQFLCLILYHLQLRVNGIIMLAFPIWSLGSHLLTGAKVNWQWGQVGWMLADHRDGLSSSTF